MKKHPPSHCIFDLSLPMEPSIDTFLSLMSCNFKDIWSIRNLPALSFCFHPKEHSDSLNLCAQSDFFYRGDNSLPWQFKEPIKFYLSMTTQFYGFAKDSIKFHPHNIPKLLKSQVSSCKLLKTLRYSDVLEPPQHDTH